LIKFGVLWDFWRKSKTVLIYFGFVAINRYVVVVGEELNGVELRE
jgi:hypothetical protein